MSREELGVLVNESADRILADTEADALALKVDSDTSLAGEQLTTQGHLAVDAVEPGAINAGDYAVSANIPSTAPESSTLFEDLFTDFQSAFMTMISGDVNIALATALREAIKILDELQALSLTIISETVKISIAANAGLLTPPLREDLEAIRDSSSSFKSEIDAAVAELRSSESRRRAARRQAGEEDNSPDGLSAIRPQVGPVPGRVLESGVGGPVPDDEEFGLALTAPRVSLNTSSDRRRPGRVQSGLADSSQKVKSDVLASIGNIALCTTISSLDVSEKTREKAARALERLSAIVDILTAAVKESFILDIQGAIQDLAIGPLRALGREVQGRLDLMDKFLRQVTTPLPTLKSTVKIIGEVPDDLVLTNSILASCGLRMDNFCGGQGMLELSLAVDSNLGVIKPRVQKFGRVCLSLLPPAIDPVAELTPEIQSPDREAQLILGAPLSSGHSQVTARFPRQNVTRVITAPAPTVQALISQSVSPADLEVRLTVFPSHPIAPVGSLTLEPLEPWAETLRYASFIIDGLEHVFTLIDLPSTVPHGSGLAATVTGQHRDTFTDVYRQRSEVGGGSGSLNVGGEGEHRHRLNYDSSTFDAVTGDYVFSLSSPYSGMTHKPQVTGTIADKRKVALYRQDIRQPAERFKVVVGFLSEIRHATNAAFNFGASVSPGDLLVLSDDENDTPVTVVSVDNVGSPTKIVISSAYHNGDVDNVTLVKVPATNAPGLTFFTARLAARQVEELRISTLTPGGPSLPLDCRAMVDTGESTRRLLRLDGNVWAQSATPGNRQRLKTAAAMFEPGDVGLQIQVQGRYPRTQVYGQVTAVVDARTVDFDSSTVLVGNINCTGSDIAWAGTGVKTRFTSEIGVGDVIAIANQRATVTVVSASSVSFTPAMALASGVTVRVIVSLAVSEPVTSTMRRFSLSRTPQEILDVVSVQLLADSETWQFNLSAATTKNHGLQRLDVSPTLQIIPGTLTAFPTPSTSVRVRVDPDVVPPGSTVLRAEFDDPSNSPLLIPLIPLSPAPPGAKLIIGKDEMLYTSAVSSGTGITFTLAAPGTPRAYGAGVVVCVLTSDIVTDLILSLVPEATWDLPFETWIMDLERHLRLFHARLCRVLQGRPEDIGQVATLMAASATAASLAIGSLQITLNALLAGLEGLEALDKLIAGAESAGMDKLALSLKSGDIQGVAQMKASSSTASGQMLQRVVAYRSKITTFGPSLKAERLADQLRGNETSTRVLGETRAGFNKAAASDIKRRRDAARRQKQEAKEVTR